MNPLALRALPKRYIPTVHCSFTQWRKWQRTHQVLGARLHVHLSYTYPRPLSPWCGVRIGEASHPGPVSSLIAQTQQTILDAFSQSSSHRRPVVAAEHEDTQLDSSMGEPVTPARGPQLPSEFEVHIMQQTEPCALSVQSRSGGRWQWVLMSSPQRLSQFAHTPAVGLAQFLHKH
eukprot:155952-Amphidinium_carterae.1